MKLELVQFENTNRVLLPGLLYEPKITTDRILIRLHGNGSWAGFYNVDKNNMFGETLTGNKIAFLTFTNTGGHILQRFDKAVGSKTERVMIGSSLELIKDCVGDIDGAVNFVKAKGYKHIYLLGGSTGANKIAVYHKYKLENEIEKYILESGGDDAGMYYSTEGEKKFKVAMEQCLVALKKSKGKELVPKYLMDYPISYQSLYDQINPEGDYNIFPFYWQLNNIMIMKKKPFGEVDQINKPTLMIYGGQDEYCYGRVTECVDLLKKTTLGKNNFEFAIIPEADHSFTNHWQGLADKVVEFLSR